MRWHRSVLVLTAVLLFGAILRAGQLATLHDGRYHHIKSGVEFPVPDGWSVLWTGDSSDGGEQVYLRDAASPDTYVAVWMKKETNTPTEADAWLELAVKMKTDQRGGESRGYRFRPNSIEHLSVGDHKAVRAAADYSDNALPVAEYFTWIFTERARVQFDVRGTDADASAVAARVEEIIHAAMIP
jgi:hypothetical protein